MYEFIKSGVKSLLERRSSVTSPVKSPQSQTSDFPSPTSEPEPDIETRDFSTSVQSMKLIKSEKVAAPSAPVVANDIHFEECTGKDFLELLDAAKNGNIQKIKYYIEKAGVDPTITSKNYEDEEGTYYNIRGAHPPLSLSDIAKVYHQHNAATLLKGFEYTAMQERITKQYYKYLESLLKDVYVKVQLKVGEGDIIFPGIPIQFTRDRKETKMKERKMRSKSDATEVSVAGEQVPRRRMT